MNTSQLAVVGPADQIAPAVPQTMEIIRAAVATGDVDMYREAVALAKELDAIAARKAFDNAIAAAKAEIPTIRRNREVDFTSTKGRTHYRFEDLAEITRTVDPILSKFGLSYRFRVNSPINEPVSVTCVVSHKDGHFEETTLHAGRDDDNSNKNSIQRIGSTITYLQRYTLKAALGLAASHDDDGAGSEDIGPITAEQVKQIEILLTETNTTAQRFCGYMKVESIDTIPAKQFQRAIDALNAKKAKS